MKIFSKKDIKLILKLYESGMAASQIAKKYTVYSQIIRDVLKQNRIFVRPSKHYFTIHFSEKEKGQIKTDYINGKSVIDITKQFKVSKGVIYRILNFQKTHIKQTMTKHRKYLVNDNFFNKIDSESVAYFLGLMYADGCLSSTKNQISISLQNQDGYILEKFKNLIYVSDKTLRYIKSKNINHSDQIILDVYSNKMHQDLTKLGCVPKKSLILKWPTKEQVPQKFIHHFIRGYFDGDGCVSVSTKKRIVNFVGTHHFINHLQKELKKYNIVSYVYPRKNVWTLNLQRKESLKNIFHFLYKNATIFMTRKKDKFIS